MNARVAVIIPTHNRASLLPETIDSLFQQTRPPDELIVVNDGSTDDTAAVLARYPSPLKAIHVPNGGRSRARNIGLCAATADFVCLLDDDDRLSPDSLAIRAAHLEAHPNIGVVYGDTRLIDEAGLPLSGEVPRANPNRPSGQVFAEIACDNLAPIHAHLFRRELLDQVGNFDESLRMGEDWDLWIRLAAITEFAYLPQHVADYRFHITMSTSYNTRRWQASNSLLIHERVLPMPAFAALPPIDQARIHARLAVRYLRLGRTAEACAAYAAALSLNPASTSYRLRYTFLRMMGKPLAWLMQSPVFETLLDLRPKKH